jgi:hypothetical protein
MDIKSNDCNQPLIVSFLTIRKGIGILGILLPVVLPLGTFFLPPCGFQTCISNYYYTRMGDCLVGMLCAMGLFLFCYKGYEKEDTIAAKLASIFALLVALFPTTPGPACTIRASGGYSWVGIVHLTSASLLFLTFAYMSIFLFTKSAGNPTVQKAKRNILYRICGYVILVSLILILTFALNDHLNSKFYKYNPIFYLEALTLWAFGLSWLIKGEFLLKDK